MIALYIYKNGRGGVCYSYAALHAATFEPEENECLILNGSHGNTYKARQASIEDQAIRYSNSFMSVPEFLDDINNIRDYFERYGKRYGLIKEFKENWII